MSAWKNGELYTCCAAGAFSAEREYLYDKAKACISRDNGEAVLYLSEKANSTMLEAVTVFEQSICEVNSCKHCEIRFDGSGRGFIINGFIRISIN